MAFIRKAIKSGIAVKVANIVMREARKPENQRKARELLTKVRNRKKLGSTAR